jgi:Flp pilus assembly protein TadG
LICSEGATLVEMALSASVLFVMLFGIIEVCMGLYSYNLVSEAARQATRYASVRGTDSCTYATKTFPNCNLNPTTSGNAIQTYVQGLGFPYSSQMNATATWWTAVQDANGSTTLPTQCTVASCNSVGNAVKVQVTYSFPLPIPFWNNATLNIKSTSEMMISE